jgi:hypothetical protein
MRILAFIEDPEVIQKILEHPGLWVVKRKPQPRAHAPPIELHIDYSRRGVGPYGPGAESQIPPSEDHLYQDPDYPVEC